MEAQIFWAAVCILLSDAGSSRMNIRIRTDQQPSCSPSCPVGTCWTAGPLGWHRCQWGHDGCHGSGIRLRSRPLGTTQPPAKSQQADAEPSSWSCTGSAGQCVTGTLLKPLVSEGRTRHKHKRHKYKHKLKQRSCRFQQELNCLLF